MGYSRWDKKDWSNYSTKTKLKTRTVDAIYTAKGLFPDFDPKTIKVRESRDSDLNPKSNAIVIGVDVTGSMNPVLDVLVKESLNTLFTELYERKPVTDPHVMINAIGDVMYDRVPYQATQFEADLRIVEQLQKIYLERGGGSNDSESYIATWLFAALKTSIDCFEKRGKKGYLFTIGDEEITPVLNPEQINRFFGDDFIYEPMSPEQLLDMVSRQYEVYHLMIEQGYYFRKHPDKVVDSWTKVLGQRAIRLSDVNKLAEVIISLIQLNEGANKEEIIKSWDGTTAVAVEKAINNLELQKADSEFEVIRF